MKRSNIEKSFIQELVPLLLKQVLKAFRQLVRLSIVVGHKHLLIVVLSRHHPTVVALLRIKVSQVLPTKEVVDILAVVLVRLRM